MQDYIQSIKALYFKNGIKTTSFNLFGIRNEDKQKDDVWNDHIGYFTGTGEIKIYKGTTDPGIYWTINSTDGAAHLCLGYHENIWKIDKHKGLYTALCNRWPCNKTRFWRDENKDTLQSPVEVIKKDYIGINLHRASAYQILQQIGKYSAACQVIVSTSNFDRLLKKATESNQLMFSYFLFDKSQIPFYKDLLKDENIS